MWIDPPLDSVDDCYRNYTHYQRNDVRLRDVLEKFYVHLKPSKLLHDQMKGLD